MSLFAYTCYLECGDIELELICELEYEPESGDGWNEPRHPEVATLCTAKIGAIDIYQSLTNEQVEEIESRALVDMAESARDAAAEYAFDRRNGAFA